MTSPLSFPHCCRCLQVHVSTKDARRIKLHTAIGSIEVISVLKMLCNSPQICDAGIESTAPFWHCRGLAPSIRCPVPGYLVYGMGMGNGIMHLQIILQENMNRPDGTNCWTRLKSTTNCLKLQEKIWWTRERERERERERDGEGGSHFWPYDQPSSLLEAGGWPW